MTARIRNTALTIAAFLAAFVLLWLSVDLFLVACTFAALVWVAVVTEQRDEATRETWAARFDAAVWKKKAGSLEAEAQELHLLLTEAQLKAGEAVRVPLLRVVRQRDGEHDRLPIADEPTPIHDRALIDAWIEDIRSWGEGADQ